MSQQLAASRVSNKIDQHPEPAENAVAPLDSDITESLEEEFSDLSEETVQIILEESKNRSRFLLWTGVYFLIYLTCLIAMALFVTNDVLRARYWFRASRASVGSWIAFGFSIGIKLIGAFAGSRMRLFHMMLFVLDCLLAMYFFLGFYFLSEDFERGAFRRHSYEYMVIGPFIVASSILGFIGSTFIPSKKLRYNPVIGFALMELCLISTTVSSMFIWNTENISKGRYIGMTVVLTLFNLYFAINSYLVVNYRTVKFFERDYIWNFYCYFADWFSFFWVDIVSNTKIMRRRRRKKARKAREQDKQAKKLARELKKVNEDEDEHKDEDENEDEVDDEESNKKDKEDKKKDKKRTSKGNKEKPEKMKKKRSTKPAELDEHSGEIAQVKDQKKKKSAKPEKQKKDKKEKESRSGDSDIEA